MKRWSRHYRNQPASFSSSSNRTVKHHFHDHIDLLSLKSHRPLDKPTLTGCASPLIWPVDAGSQRRPASEVADIYSAYMSTLRRGPHSLQRSYQAVGTRDTNRKQHLLLESLPLSDFILQRHTRLSTVCCQVHKFAHNVFLR